MIKSKLITEIGRKKTNLSESDIKKCINLILDKMIDHIADGGRIEIRGFGCFYLRFRPTRLAHNPKTGKRLMTAPKLSIRFKPGKEMKERIDASKGIPIRKATEED